MPRKVDAGARCADLLAALARTANVAQACRDTGISKYWAYRRRAADGDFARRWATAMRVGERRAAREAAARACRPIGGAGGARLIAPPLIVQGRAGTGTRRLQRPAIDSFCPERRLAFLDALRATCNVQAARIAAGVGSSTVYRHYHEDAAFRGEWDAALAEGREHLEMALMGAARALFESPDGRACPGGLEVADEQAAPVVGPCGITGMDAGVALQLLRLHRPTDASGRPRGRWVKPADADETRREILAKVAAVRAAREREAGVVADPDPSPSPRPPRRSSGQA